MRIGFLSIPHKGYTLQGLLANKSEAEVGKSEAEVRPIAFRLFEEISYYSFAGQLQGTDKELVPPLILAISVQNNCCARYLVELSLPWMHIEVIVAGAGVGRGAPLARTCK